MAEDLQIPGGSSQTEDQYIGPARALRVDTDNDELRLHDGAKVGGFRFPNIDSLTVIFQVKNAELDGFKFDPSKKGFMVRVSPGQYALRRLTVDAANLTIANPLGTADNPLVGLRAEISSPHTWTALQSFSSIEVSDGISGTHNGPVVGNVTGNLTGDSEGTHTGDVDVQGHGIAFDPGQIPWAAIDPDTIPIPPDPVPEGVILMWHGAIEDVPTGWFLCDGTNGTPDLRNRFVIGAGDSYDPLETGGTEVHNHVINIENAGTHSHTVEVDDTILDLTQIPSHQHPSGVCDTGSVPAFNRGAVAASPPSSDNVETSSSDGTHEALGGFVGGGAGHNHTASSGDSGLHTHGMDSENTDHRPPYYALCFIMKAIT